MFILGSDERVYIYGVKTDAFYTDAEHEIGCKISKLLKERWRLRRKRELLPEDVARLSAVREEIGELKSELRKELSSHTGIRSLRQDCVDDKSVISIFESNLTRTLGMRRLELSEDMVVVRVFYFEVFRDIVLDGFYFRGERYVFFSASAGQIRTKKAVFIKEKLLRKHELSLMCGLTIDKINELGGCNTNKFLAYLSLCNSSSDEWPLDINKAIVVDDFETLVNGEVDYIDADFNITRKRLDVPIVHSDGCGMVLPRVTGGKNTMIRAPWIKGLLAAFPFDEFIRKKGGNPVVRDIYGTEHDVLADGIEIIFTKSMFKLYAYYQDWNQYKQYYRKYKCSAGICNMEPDYIPNSTLNYQVMQTLTDITDDELNIVSGRTRQKVRDLSTDKNVMLRALGAVSTNTRRTPAQECLMLYPELLQDTHYRSVLRDLKTSMEYDAWSGRLDVYAKYTFVVPDLYAFCEKLFLGVKNPKGLLFDGEVYCGLYRQHEKLDCLRSPHLYKEHAVRKNMASYVDLSEWFGDTAIYTSCHDLISKTLQFDNDGDKLLVCADPTIIKVADRNMRGVVPLYYEMKKAGNNQLNKLAIYNGMITAYTGGNIGGPSNDITKELNGCSPDEDTIKRLCAIVNFTIDSAKTLYLPTPPPAIKARLNALASQKLPHFFVFAKKKRKEQVLARSDTGIDRLQKIIPTVNFNFSAKKLGRYDYKMLMGVKNPDTYSQYDAIVQRYIYLATGVGPAKTDDSVDSYSFLVKAVRDKMFSEFTCSRELIVSCIIEDLFGKRKSKNKRIFWGAFGDVVLTMLKRNIEERFADYVICRNCTVRYPISELGDRCPNCGKRNMNVVRKKCIDCGEMYEVDVFHANNPNHQRCGFCMKIYRALYKVEHNRNWRQKRKSEDRCF